MEENEKIKEYKLWTIQERENNLKMFSENPKKFLDFIEEKLKKDGLQIIYGNPLGY